MKKWLSALLAVLMLLPLSACADTNDTEETVAETQKEEIGSGDVESETTEMHDVAKQNYKGASFRMVSIQNEPGEWYYAEEYISGGENTHILNNTIYEMNSMVESHLGVSIQYENVPVTDGHDVYQAVMPSLMSNDDTYQLCILHPYYDYNAFISQGFAKDFYALEDIDLTKPYWNAEVMEQLSINGRAYIGLGDLCKYNLDILYCNKELLADAGRSMPYNLVREKKWTLDEFLTLTTGLFMNKGSDAHDNQDVYGFASLWDANASAFMQASGIYVLNRNEDEMFELSIYSERLVTMYEKLLRLSEDESTYLWTYGNDKNPDYYLDFHDNRTYVTLDELGTQYLDADFEVGMLPLPKYDVAQEQYAHPNWGNNIIVPSTVKNEAMVGQVLELMAYYSRNLVQKVYYDEVLQLRVSDAPDDREMVELIYNTVVFDPGIAYCDGYQPLWDMVYLPTFAILQKEGNIASRCEKAKRQIERQKILEKIFEVKGVD